MYATDLSDGSEEALRFSIRLAHAFDASLTVAHVVRFAAGSFYGVEAAALPTGYTDDVRARAAETLSRTVGLVSDGSVPISTLVAEGVPWQTINDLAAQNRADLLIISLQGKGRLERMMLGATAEHLIRAAAVPVLSLPLPAAYESRWLAA
jgi:nucleotide-binding universal stress UspA family protein